MDTTQQALARFQATNYPYWKLFYSGKNSPFVTRTVANDNITASYEQLQETIANLADGAYTLRMRRTFEDSGDKDRVEIPFIKNTMYQTTAPALNVNDIRAKIEAEVRKEIEERTWKETIEKRLAALEAKKEESERFDKQLEKDVETLGNALAVLPKLKSSFSNLKN